MKEDKTLELVEIIFKISRLMSGEMSYTNNLIHLSILQIQTLIFLKQNKNKKVSMSEIAESFRIELPSATSLVDKLYDQKLVERHIDQQDRRLVLITLTTKGRVLLEQAMFQRRKKIEKILSYLPTKEKAELLTILKTLNNRLQERNEN